MPPFQAIDATVFAFDIYFGGRGDVVEDLTFAPLGELFVASVADIPGGGSTLMSVPGWDGDFRRNPGQLGLLVFTNGDRGQSSRGGATEATEALLFTDKAP